MKISWGYAIVLAFIMFISFIMYFVVLAQTDESYDNQLVITNYYEHELGINAIQEKEANASALPKAVSINVLENKVEIIFPNVFKYENITGNVFFYRPSDEKLDFDIPIQLKDSVLEIPRKALREGKWKLKVDWEYQGKGYIKQQDLEIK
ncbi:MAG: FixH family protein [Bacteroidota bacterium]|nr:FixH family protein [Bacteroidota bacterium]